MLLVSIWLGLLLLLPAALNQYLLNQYPLPEAFATTIKQRKGYHEKWDLPKEPTLAKFYAHYPQYQNIPLPNTTFNWTWYYAMQQMGDDESAAESGQLRQKLDRREAVSHWFGWFVPALYAQLQLNDLARSGLGNQARFLDETTRFHERLRLYFYPRIIASAPVKNERWDRHRVETFRDRAPVGGAGAWLPPVLFVLFFAGLGWLNFRRNLHEI